MFIKMLMICPLSYTMKSFLFTCQGVEWVTINRAQRLYRSHNLYPKDGNEQSVYDKLQIAKNWPVEYNVLMLCGVYNKYAGLYSRCRYIKAVRQNLKAMRIHGMLCDYNRIFSIFNGKPPLQHLSACIKDAIGFNEKK